MLSSGCLAAAAAVAYTCDGTVDATAAATASAVAAVWAKVTASSYLSCSSSGAHTYACGLTTASVEKTATAVAKAIAEAWASSGPSECGCELELISETSALETVLATAAVDLWEAGCVAEGAPISSLHYVHLRLH